MLVVVLICHIHRPGGIAWPSEVDSEFVSLSHVDFTGVDLEAKRVLAERFEIFFDSVDGLIIAHVEDSSDLCVVSVSIDDTIIVFGF